MKAISSRDNPRIRLLLKLIAQPRECRRQQLTVLDGVHLLRSLLDSGGHPLWGAVTGLALTRDEVAAAVADSTQRGTEWFELPEALFKAVAPTAHPSGVLALFPLPLAAGPTGPDAAQGLGDQAFVLMLEAIQDPGNLGTLLRSAQGAGVACVALSPGCAEPWSPKVLRAGMGAHFFLDLYEDVDLPALAAQRGGVWAAAADGGRTAWQAPLANARGLVIGNEGAGITPALRAACQGSVAIPLQAGCESLNAAIAGSVLLFERARQRLD